MGVTEVSVSVQAGVPILLEIQRIFQMEYISTRKNKLRKKDTLLWQNYKKRFKT